MLERALTPKEIEIRETLIRILERTLPSLEQDERVIAKRCILRMKSEIAEMDRRRKEYDRRKAEQKRKLSSHCSCPSALARFGQDHE